MQRFFDQELENFRSQLILMGETAVRQVQLSLTALTTGDPKLAQRVIEGDDIIDQL